MALVPIPKNCDPSVRRAIQKLNNKLGPGAIDHNELAGLDGGIADQYYHLTTTQHTNNLIGEYVSEYGALEVTR